MFNKTKSMTRIKKMIKINTFGLERKSINKDISLCFKEKKQHEEALLPKRERN